MRLLIVEDDFLLASVLVSAARNRGHDVLGPAADLRTTDELVKERIDGAVLDVNLRGTSSAPIAQKLHDAGVPFVVYSGHGREHLEGALNRGVFVSKPANPERLVHTLESSAREAGWA